METADARRRIAGWEIMRVPFNMVCLLGASLSWNAVGAITAGIDELPPPALSDEGAMRNFVIGFEILNAAYCLIYAIEFVAGALTPRFARGMSVAAYFAGCGLGFIAAMRGSAGIAHSIVTDQRIALERAARAEDMKRLREEVARQRRDARTPP